MRTLTRLLLLLGLCIPALGQARPQVTLDEAERLVLAGLPATTKHLPKFGLEHFPEEHSSHFYFFTAYWAGAPNGSMVIGNYAVDKLTADVWNAPAACDEISTLALRKFQQQVRLRIGLSTTGYRKMKRRCPLELEDVER